MGDSNNNRKGGNNYYYNSYKSKNKPTSNGHGSPRNTERYQAKGEKLSGSQTGGNSSENKDNSENKANYRSNYNNHYYKNRNNRNRRNNYNNQRKAAENSTETKQDNNSHSKSDNNRSNSKNNYYFRDSKQNRSGNNDKNYNNRSNRNPRNDKQKNDGADLEALQKSALEYAEKTESEVLHISAKEVGPEPVSVDKTAAPTTQRYDKRNNADKKRVPDREAKPSKTTESLGVSSPTEIFDSVKLENKEKESPKAQVISQEAPKTKRIEKPQTEKRKKEVKPDTGDIYTEVFTPVKSEKTSEKPDITDTQDKAKKKNTNRKAERTGRSSRRGRASGNAELTEEEKKQARINRQKSDKRFWARLASLGFIIPAYAALLVCAVALPRSTVSNIEKRNLATMPEFTAESYLSGQYTADVANWFDDTVPFRDSLKQLASRFTGFFGIKYNDVQVSGAMEIVNKPSKEDTSEAVESNSSFAGSISSGSKDKKKKDSDTDSEKQVKGEEIADGVYANGIIVVYQDNHYRAMTMYGGGTGETWAASLNNFADDLPNVEVYSLVAPTASEFYTPENFADYNASQEDDIKNIGDMLQNVKNINVCPTLLSHKKESIYTRTDHHWMSLGAYYAAEDFAKAAGVPFLDISRYTRMTKPDYVGTLYTFSDNNANLLNDPEDFIYYEPKKKDYTVEYYDYAFNYVYEGELLADVQVSSEYYSTFINGDAYSVKIKTGVKNNRRCLIVKDSYGDALVPFLTGSFEEVYVVDMRYFERNLVDFAKENDITDLLFTCCSYSAVGTNADNLENLRTSGLTGSTAESNTESDTDSESEGTDTEITDSESWTQEDNSSEAYNENDLYTSSEENYNNEPTEYEDVTSHGDVGFIDDYTEDGAASENNYYSEEW